MLSLQAPGWLCLLFLSSISLQPLPRCSARPCGGIIICTLVSKSCLRTILTQVEVSPLVHICSLCLSSEMPHRIQKTAPNQHLPPVHPSHLSSTLLCCTLWTSLRLLEMRKISLKQKSLSTHYLKNAFWGFSTAEVMNGQEFSALPQSYRAAVMCTQLTVTFFLLCITLRITLCLPIQMPHGLHRSTGPGVMSVSLAVLISLAILQ